MDPRFICKHFSELSLTELYAILQIRLEVFSIEQHCFYRYWADRDPHSYHLMCWQEGVLVAYSRLLPVGISYPTYCSIGRVLTKSTVRRNGIGKALLHESIQICRERFSGPIKIGAQSYLEKFYNDFGFVSTGHHYLEDDIPHMSMLLAE